MRAFQVYGYTDRGAVRELNEDHILIGRFIKNSGGMGMYFLHSDDFLNSYGLIFAVADGIGGENAGEVASKFALTAFDRQFYGVEKNPLNTDEYITSLTTSANRANETILQLAASKTEWSNMGCTLSGICITPTGYYVYNAGDSRVYRYRNGILKPLTSDDTITNLAIQTGSMSFEEAKDSRSRHTLINSLGTPSFKINIEAGPEIRDNDLILICSDGLHDMLSDEEMERVIDTGLTVEQIGKMLYCKAMGNGGQDNISIIVIRSDVFEEDVNWKPGTNLTVEQTNNVEVIPPETTCKSEEQTTATEKGKADNE